MCLPAARQISIGLRTRRAVLLSKFGHTCRAGRLRPAGVVKVLDRLLKRLGQIACLVGLHDFRVVEVTFGFGGSDAIEKLECRRCGRSAARRA
jgi:hypothetical protein